MSENNAEVHKPDTSKMEYRYLGNSGHKVKNYLNEFKYLYEIYNKYKSLKKK